ncbi:Conidiation protein 6-domain-containing protein [Aspergillus cavernicola]|uniref:Conidiation protein 6-domain-containing protein n=1 Tax=Aspergillus cavernicola TaxID=176166 RepID=A0ABR4HR22_9EURO
MADERVNQMRGYKATLNNPNVSQEAKDHAQSVLDSEFGGNRPQEELYNIRGDRDKSPNRMAGGLKAAMHNPGVSTSGKEQAKAKLGKDAPQE